MSRDEMPVRMGLYSGLASRVLKDDSYAARWLGRAHELTEEDYIEATHEIQSRLVKAGFIGPDEDPYGQFRKTDWRG